MNDAQNMLAPVAGSPDAECLATLSPEKPVQQDGQYDVLVMDAKLRQSLVSVRSFGQRGMRAAALEMENLAQVVPTFASRWCQRSFIAPSFEHAPEIFVQYLERLLEANNVRVLITSSDGTLAVIRQYRERLERRVKIALASESALVLAINKDQTLALAEQLGVGVPHGVHVKSVSEVPAALHEVGLPVVVKPVESWVWGDDNQSDRLICKLATTLEEAQEAVEALTLSGGTVLIQQFLAGEREAVSLLYANGEIYARFAQWARRMQPPLGGTSVYRQSIAVPQDIGEQAERLVRAIDLEGYCEVEFRRDAAGKACLMEINPRLSASVEVAVRAGVDFPYLLFQWANGERIDRITNYRTGRWMRYLQGDFLTTMQCVSQRGRPGVTPPARAMLDFATAFFVPSGYDYFDWKDLRPGFAATRDFGRTIVRRLKHGSSQ
jgi:predicted ATP-grasp superfamily ATP-dependent carboligase